MDGFSEVSEKARSLQELAESEHELETVERVVLELVEQCKKTATAGQETTGQRFGDPTRGSTPPPSPPEEESHGGS